MTRYHPSMDKMEKRHSSPPPRAMSPRPSTHRKRSNSFPVGDVLGCSTPEAELILAEGRAAIRSRHASAHRRGRRKRSLDNENEEARTFRPQDHLQYLDEDSAISEHVVEGLGFTRGSRHSRIPSNVTDNSTSTIVGSTQPIDNEAQPPSVRPGSPLGDYSANLAKFIQSQLNSIPTYKANHSSISPRSCPDLTFRSQSPPLSPAKLGKRSVDMPNIIEIPPIRPPLMSAFSAWSSTDDEADDEVPPLPGTDLSSKGSKASNYTPSLLGYYEHANDSSFLFSSTPLDEEQPDTAKGFSFPEQSALSGSPAEPHSPAQHDEDYPSSALSTHPRLTASSAPSFSSSSTASYFDCKRPISLAPEIRDRIIAAVTPQHGNGKIVPAISPFEGGALANVHDILVESQQRVHVDGMSFDMIRDFSVPDDAMRKVPTPC